MNNNYYHLGMQVIIMRKLLFLMTFSRSAFFITAFHRFKLTFTKLTQAYQESNDKTALQEDPNICFHY